MPMLEKHFCLNFGQAIFNLAKLFKTKALQCIIGPAGPLYSLELLLLLLFLCLPKKICLGCPLEHLDIAVQT